MIGDGDNDVRSERSPSRAKQDEVSSKLMTESDRRGRASLTTHMTAPAIQSELYMEVKGARYCGYDNSVTSMGAAFAVSPMSSKHIFEYI